MSPRPPRFWENVDKSGECWIWTAALDQDGYGKCRYGGSVQRAHRVAWDMLVGPIPDGLHLDHLCRVRACVNPMHLEPVTNRVNLLRGDTHAARNAAKTHCPKGHEYTDENTQRKSNGSRICRTCSNRKETCAECGASISRAGLRRHERNLHGVAA
jgi:hypothetical protein